MSGTSNTNVCKFCGLYYHGDHKCHLVKAIEFHENGTIKRVEFHEPHVVKVIPAYNSAGPKP